MGNFPKVSSIRFNVEAAKAEALRRKWTNKEWAEQAGVSIETLKSFLAQDPRMKNLTVEQIVQPLGYNAIDFLVRNVVVKVGPQRRQPAGT